MLQRIITPQPRRNLRVLVVSDSILNMPWLDDQLAALSGLPLASVMVCRRSYGGSMSPAGMAQAAIDVAAYGQSGNLLRKSDLNTWATSNLTRTVDTNPISGLACVRVDGSNTSARLQTSLGTSSYATVPAGAPPLTFSVEITRGTYNSFELTIYNGTSGATIVSELLRSAYLDANTIGNLPTRYAITAFPTDGAGYSAGNHIQCFIAFGNTDAPSSGTCWVRDPLLNVGIWPLDYRPTSGTAETPASAAWVVPTPATSDLSAFDIVAIDFLNDVGSTGADSYEAIMSAIVRGVMARGARRVVLCAPPPTADVGLTTWSATQSYNSLGLLTALRNAAANTGAYFYDAWSDFQARTATGSNTVSALMRDTIHPTDSALGANGLVAYATPIWQAIQAPAQGPMPGNTPFVRLGFESVTGGWAATRVTQTSTSPNNDLGSLVSAFGTGTNSIRAYTSTTTGTLTVTTPACEQIGLLHLVHSTAGGEVDVSIDGGAAVRVNTTVSGAANNYGRGSFIVGGLTRTTHTVAISWVSGTPAIVGVSGC